MIHLHLDLTQDGTALIGQIGLADGPTRPFTGWMGLNAAIEELLGESLQTVRPPDPVPEDRPGGAVSG